MKAARLGGSMNDEIIKYLIAKEKREGIHKSSINATRTEMGINLKMEGRGLEFIEMISLMVEAACEKAGCSFEQLCEILRLESSVKKEKEIRKDTTGLFNKMFNDLLSEEGTYEKED